MEVCAWYTSETDLFQLLKKLEAKAVPLHAMEVLGVEEV
jgi:hypothetical protein